MACRPRDPPHQALQVSSLPSRATSNKAHSTLASSTWANGAFFRLRPKKISQRFVRLWPKSLSLPPPSPVVGKNSPCVKPSPDESRRRLHTNTAYAPMGFSRRGGLPTLRAPTLRGPCPTPLACQKIGPRIDLEKKCVLPKLISGLLLHPVHQLELTRSPPSSAVPLPTSRLSGAC